MPNLSGLSTNFFPTPKEGFTTTISGTVDSSTDTEVPLNSVSGLNNGDIFTGIIDPGNAKERAFTGVVDTGGSQITNVVFTTGSNATHTAGATVVDYVTSTHIAQMTKGIKVSHDNDGTLKAGAVDNAGVLASDVVTTAKILDANVTTAKIADANVTSPKLAEAFFRGRYQSNTTNSAPTGLTVQHGWGFLLGDGDDTATETVTFPTAFSSINCILITFNGTKAGSDPTGIVDSLGANNIMASATGATTSQFTVVISDVDGGTLSGTTRYAYSWMAIGTV